MHNKSLITTILVIFLPIIMIPAHAAGGLRFAWSDSGAGNSAQTTSTSRPHGGVFPKLVLGLEVLHDEYQAYVIERDQALQLGKSVAPFKSKQTLAHTINETVVIDAMAANDVQTLVSRLKNMGAKYVTPFGRLVSATVAINSLPKIASLTELSFARPSLFITHAGSINSQGDTAMAADSARTTFSVDGSGVTVGVLSDSYNCQGGAAGGISSGDLPAGVNVLQDDAGTACTSQDEGRAMLEIVHDVAPGAGLAFHTADLGEANFAQGIIDLANIATAKIVVDDVIYLAEPMFQDGIIAQAVDSLKSLDVSYFSSAGNNAKSSYEADYASGTLYGVNAFPRLNASIPRFDGGISHDFSGSGDDMQQFTLQPGANLTIVMEWQNAYPSLGGPSPVNDDMDVYLLDSTNTVVAASTVNQASGTDPVEIFGLNYSGASAIAVNLMIVSNSKTDPGRIKYVIFGNGFSINEYHTYSSTAYGHANAAHARAVGAAYYANTPAFGVYPPLLETFSSRGGVPILFDIAGNPVAAEIIRPKPEIVAPDGANTTFFYPGSDRDGDGYPNFSGTSAAAPHAGGVAALLKNAKPDATVGQIYAAIQESAIDMSIEGFDYDSGMGLIQAPAALDYVLAQNTQALLGFSTLFDGTPIPGGSTFISTEYQGLGVSMSDNDITPTEIRTTYIGIETAGIKGNFIQVDGTAPQLTLIFSPSINHVEFDFVSADGNVAVDALDDMDVSIQTNNYIGTISFSTTGLAGLEGHASITTASPITKLIINAAAIDNLVFNNVTPTSVSVPAVSSLGQWVLLMCLVTIGWVRLQSRATYNNTSKSKPSPLSATSSS